MKIAKRKTNRFYEDKVDLDRPMKIFQIIHIVYVCLFRKHKLLCENYYTFSKTIENKEKRIRMLQIILYELESITYSSYHFLV